jgi:Fic family protein
MPGIAFDRNVPFNNLPMLSPLPEIENNPAILKKLVTASRALAKVDGKINKLPNPTMLVNTIALQEARTSTEIENIFTTDDELYKAVSESKSVENSNPATKEVLRYRESLWAGFHALKEKHAIDNEMIIRIFQRIKDTTAGFRAPQANVVIRKGQSEFHAGEIIYTPPRGEGIIESLMGNLSDYLNDDVKYPTDPLLKMCIAHYQFEAIHPFQDGNGRTGRILNLLYLVDKGLLAHPSLYLSKFIILNKDEYYHKLGAVTQRESWHAWVAYMLDAVEQTANLTSSLTEDILNQMDQTLEYARNKVKWYNKDINEAIFSQPYIKAKTIGKILEKTSRTTLTKYVNELVEYKIIRPKRDGVEVYFINDDLLRILAG